jgi:hypothetical protein
VVASRVAFGGVLVAVRKAWMMIGNAVRELYWVRGGEPTRRARFEVGDYSIEVYQWAADANPEGVALYATVAASAQAMAGWDPSHRVEFFLELLPEQDEVASALAALGLFSVREGVALDHGHTLPADKPLWPGTQMRAFLVLRPPKNSLPPLALGEGCTWISSRQCRCSIPSGHLSQSTVPKLS